MSIPGTVSEVNSESEKRESGCCQGERRWRVHRAKSHSQILTGVWRVPVIGAVSRLSAHSKWWGLYLEDTTWKNTAKLSSPQPFWSAMGAPQYGSALLIEKRALSNFGGQSRDSGTGV